MDPFHRETFKALFERARSLNPERRPAFLDRVCADDPELRQELDQYLADAEEASAFFYDLAGDVLPRAPMPEPTPDPHGLIGQTVAHYEVLEQLGAGGMGVVYKARNTRLDNTVALKFLPPHLLLDHEARQRFTTEAKAASALDHPNICTIHDIGETDDGRLFIVMAYYAGQTLKSRLQANTFSIKDSVEVAIQMAEGLTRAHEAGIVHRDVKPANVMMTDPEQVKLLDFGLAKRAGALDLTQTGMMLGTVAYMSPEQSRGEKVDHRTDIWSLGVVLYELLTGLRPFPGENVQAVLYNLRNRDPQPLIALSGSIPLQLAHVINKALAKPLHERYQTMSALRDDLGAVRRRKATRSSAARAMIATPGTEEASASGERPAGEGVPILIVDDEPRMELLIRRRFRHQIRRNEWSLRFAASGIEALHILAEDPDIALVLTDLHMPGMDGLTLLARMAELDRPLKTIVVSAYGDMDNIRTAMNRGAFDFVTKPVDFNDLEATIYKTLQELVTYRHAVQAQRQLVTMQHELEVAYRIQEALLPLSFPRRPDVDLYAFMTTARDVSGTFYDYLELDQHRIAFIIGDVAGKGVSAALFMAMSVMLLKGIAQQDETPGACLTAMNRTLSPQGLPEPAVTVFYGLLDTTTGTLDYCNAGHPPPYRLGKSGDVMLLEGPVEQPVWKASGHTYETARTVLVPGEGLLLYTEGITGALDRHQHPFTHERLSALLRETPNPDADQLIRDVVRAVMHHTAEVPLAQDLTALALRYHG